MKSKITALFISGIFMLILIPQQSAAADKAIINKVVIGKNPKSKEDYKFSLGEVVFFKRNSDGSFLAKTGEWQEEFNIPPNALIMQSAFKPIEKWDKERIFDCVIGDYHCKYLIRNDGSFKLEESSSRKVINGKLHKNGNLIWARRNNKPNEFSQGDIFILKTNGKLCMKPVGFLACDETLR